MKIAKTLRRVGVHRTGIPKAKKLNKLIPTKMPKMPKLKLPKFY